MSTLPAARAAWWLSCLLGVMSWPAAGAARATAERPAAADKLTQAQLFPDSGRHKKPPGSLQTTQGFANLASTLEPAVASITSTQFSVDDSGRRRRAREQGSGVIIHPGGFILTNNHVIDNASDIRVRLHDERELPARLVGRDERTDIALLKIDAGPAPLRWAPLGDSDHVRIGEWVMAIGNPFGLDHSFTVGIISAKGRREVQPGNVYGFFDFLQTDASINPGNSGGPLIDARGEVIGINTAITGSGNGIGFAIPSNIVRVIADQLYKTGRVTRSWLGVYPQPVTESLRRAFNLPDRHGALLAEVFADSPAAQAGLLDGDVIVEFNGRPVKRSDDLFWLLGQTELPKVALRFIRNGVAQTAEVQFERSPATRSDPPAAANEPTRGRPSALGITVSELTETLAKQIGYEEGRGVVIMLVEPSSPAMESGVERGDIIVRINGQPVQSLQEYATAMQTVPAGGMIRLLVRREEQKQWHNFWLAFPRR